MTDKSDQNPIPKRETRRSRGKRQRDAINDARADRPTVSPLLNPGPGRKRILDPDQATLDENIRHLCLLASIQSTLGEAAAHLSVSVDTLRDFLQDYPALKEKWDDCRLSGVISIRSQLFKNLTGDKGNRPDPETARWMADRLAGIQDPYKLKELDRKEREFERQREAFEQTMELKRQELAQRERDVVIKERELELKIKDLGPGPPIDIKSLSMTQLMDLAARLRTSMRDRSGLTMEDVKSFSSSSSLPAGEKSN